MIDIFFSIILLLFIRFNNNTILRMLDVGDT